MSDRCWADDSREDLLCEIPSANNAGTSHSQDPPRDAPRPQPHRDSSSDRPVGPAVDVPFPCCAAFVWLGGISLEEESEYERKERDGGEEGDEEDCGGEC